MADADLDIEGIDELIKAIVASLDVPLRAVSMAIAAEAQDRIAPYPNPSGKPQAFKTVRQRRGFFAKLRSGQITVPYRRRGAGGGVLGGWMSEPTTTGARLRNTRPEAAFVHSAQQARYFQGSGWKTDKGISEGIVSDGTAARMVEQALQKHFDTELGG